MRYLKRLSILCLVAFGLYGQADVTTPKYEVYKETILSTAAEVITIQQPATGAKQIYFIDASIYCSAACVPTLEKNGTAATTTTLAVIQLQDAATTSGATAFSSSNVGIGTVLAKISISAGDTKPIDLTGIGLTTNNTAKNFTIRTDAISGTVRIVIRWIEK